MVNIAVHQLYRPWCSKHGEIHHPVQDENVARAAMNEHISSQHRGSKTNVLETAPHETVALSVVKQ